MDTQTISTCCGVDWTVQTAHIALEGPHRVARCAKCVKRLRALPGKVEDFTMPFGKYKGAIASELWLQDARYCEWLLTVDWLKPRLRDVLEKTKP